MFQRFKKRPVRIVIADDDDDMRQFLETLLAAEGAVVMAFENGQLALEAIRADKPDLVVLDVEMPVMGGFEVLRELREDEKTKDLKVAMLTIKSGKPHVVGGLLIGADDYIIKGTPADQLVGRIMNLV